MTLCSLKCTNHLIISLALSYAGGRAAEILWSLYYLKSVRSHVAEIGLSQIQYSAAWRLFCTSVFPLNSKGKWEKDKFFQISLIKCFLLNEDRQLIYIMSI